MLRTRGQLIVVGVAVLGLATVPLASARSDGPPVAHATAAVAGDPIRAEVRNGTTVKETEIIGKFNATTGSKGGYVTRQSNTQTGSKAGGGAIYGCRGAAGGTSSGSAPCLRASNLAAGFAFEFAGEGAVVGQISVGDGKTANSKAKPFTTNATGVATGLNADQVDGKSASDIAAGVSVGGVHVEADGRLTAGINRRGSTPTVSRTGTGQYTVTFPGFTASGDALPQVTIIGGQFGFVRADAQNGAVRVFTANVAGTAEDRGFALTLFDTAP
jgi:hypothetical protein